MKRPHLILGLLLLGVAAAVGFYTSQPNPRAAPPTTAAVPAANAARNPTSPATAATDLPQRPIHPRPTAADALRIEPLNPSDAGLVARARRIDDSARGRLELLTEQLTLTTGQQRRVYPLLVRSHPEFDESLQILGGIHVGPPGRISKSTADQFIQALLDPDQMLDSQIAAAQDDIWWTHVIAKLEKDLVEATSPAAATAPPPEPGVAPAIEEPRTAPRAHRGGNLFDPVENDEP